MDTKPKILYVDDEEINLQLFDINFSQKYNVCTAYNAIKGLACLAADSDIQIIISDMKMPEMNGIEFIKKAKEHYPSKKYYILTGFEITNEIQEAINKGLILKYFRKPYNAKEIEATIEVAIRI
jgi:two-component system response regulator (stage 0 sporulation protein F)